MEGTPLRQGEPDRAPQLSVPEDGGADSNAAPADRTERIFPGAETERQTRQDLALRMRGSRCPVASLNLDTRQREPTVSLCEDEIHIGKEPIGQARETVFR